MSISSPSSSRAAWPDTWTFGSTAFQMTSDPRQVRGERREQHPPGRRGDDAVECLDDNALRRGVPGALDADTVGEERQQTALGDAAQRPTVEWSVLAGELEVAGEEEASGWR